MAGIELPIGCVYTLKSKYCRFQWKKGDTYSNGAYKVVKLHYEPRKWWQFWKKRVVVGYDIQRIK